MNTIDDLISRAYTKEHLDDEKYWADLIEDMKVFLQEDHPEEEKSRIRPIGAMEKAYMMLSGIQYKKANNI